MNIFLDENFPKKAKEILEKLSWFVNNYIYEKNDNTCYLITDTKCNIYR
jgi:hypothetical protein